MALVSQFNFQRVIANLQKVKVELPKLLANDTKNHFVRSFNSSKWDGKDWKEVERRKEGARVKKSRSTEHILVQSGRLRRALINSIKNADWAKIKLELTDVPYARVHNEGLRAGRGSGFQMPKRQFVGDTKELRNIQISRIKSVVDKIWK